LAPARPGQAAATPEGTSSPNLVGVWAGGDVTAKASPVAPGIAAIQTCALGHDRGAAHQVVPQPRHGLVALGIRDPFRRISHPLTPKAGPVVKP
jgi:hypothetical protein